MTTTSSPGHNNTAGQSVGVNGAQGSHVRNENSPVPGEMGIENSGSGQGQGQGGNNANANANGDAALGVGGAGEGGGGGGFVDIGAHPQNWPVMGHYT